MKKQTLEFPILHFTKIKRRIKTSRTQAQGYYISIIEDTYFCNVWLPVATFCGSTLAEAIARANVYITALFGFSLFESAGQIKMTTPNL